MSSGEYADNKIVRAGHGQKYYSVFNNRIKETLANYSSLAITRPDLIDVLKRDKPELVDALDKLIDEMLEEGY